MPQNEEKREYNFGDDVLMQKADFLVNSMTRDAEAFEKRKIDGSRREEIAKINEQFKDIPTDEELVGEIKIANEQKDASALELRQLMSSVRSMAETKYGNTGKYKTFNFGELSSLPISDMYRTARRVVRVGTKLLKELESEGLTDDILKQIAATAKTLDDRIDLVEEAEEERDLKRQERVRVGNKLWALMVKYANVGKSLFEFTDEARYNDYVLIETSPKTGSDDAPTQPTT